jgi:hypothetical protein
LCGCLSAAEYLCHISSTLLLACWSGLFWIYEYKLITLNLVNLAKFSYTILVYCIKTNSTETNHLTIERREVLHMDYSSVKLELNYYMLITRNHERIDNTKKTLFYSLSIFSFSGENLCTVWEEFICRPKKVD